MLALLKILIKGIQVVGLLIAVLVLNACSDGEKNSSLIFEELNESLEESTSIIQNQSNDFYHGLQDKLYSPEAYDLAAFWQPVALKVKDKSTAIIEYIDSLKFDLRKEAKWIKANNGDSFTNKQVEKKVSNDRVKELFDKIKNYKQSILAINKEMEAAVKNKVILMPKFFDLTDSTDLGFYKKLIDEKKVLLSYSFLSKLQNSIAVSENKVIAFCYNKCNPGCRLGFIQTTALITQSSNNVQPGDEIEITAGIGYFSNEAAPKIFIGGKQIESENGIASYKIKINEKPGKYKVPVKITYTDQDGQKITKQKDIEYAVVNK